MASPTPDPLLELETRRRLYQLLQDYPGLHEREAARQLRTSQALVNFHRAILEENGLLSVDRADGHLRMFAKSPEAPTPTERLLLAALRNRNNLHLTLLLLDFKRPAKHLELAEGARMAKSTVSFYLRKLETAGVVEKTEDGLFAVIQPRRVHQLLTKFRPTPDLLEEFSELWSHLYDV